MLQLVAAKFDSCRRLEDGKIMADIDVVVRQQAETLVAQDPSHYPSILPAILALVVQPSTSLRRWIAHFLTNTFANKRLDAQVKEDLATTVLDALRTLIDDGDFTVVKSCVLCSSLIYPLLFRRV